MVANRIAIRREEKNVWERRAPLIPEHVGQLIGEHGLEFAVQHSDIRVFSDDEYREVGAEVREDVGDCSVMFGVKEIPASVFRSGHSYVFFAHVVKGQKHNMAMLRRMMELGCNLIDYEKITDDAGRRLVFFGRFAGIAGMTDTLAGLGRRLELAGLATPLRQVRLAHEYGRVELLKAALAEVGREVASQGLPEDVVPLVVGVTGYGHVAKGAWEVLDALGAVEVEPVDLPALAAAPDRRSIYRVMFREEHMVEPVKFGHRFDLKEYFTRPELYRSKFEEHLEYLTVLANCIYWDARYPRLVTLDWLKQAFGPGRSPRLLAIGDISCDIGGSVEATVKATDPGAPFYVYDPLTGVASDGLEGRGVLMMAVDNLPCELPFDSSRAFGTALIPFVPAIAKADFGIGLDRLDLPGPVRRALILHRGRLTPEYAYIEKFMTEQVR
uniref:Alanine dehydrogenase/pyridine nucleotide transhydrogenase N-terminal domain-containing protein n=1 Tax=candidate division WOR-3 bacterium TaxID=2052148 RepID=A0A7C4CEG2_UNCW3